MRASFDERSAIRMVWVRMASGSATQMNGLSGWPRLDLGYLFGSGGFSGRKFCARSKTALLASLTTDRISASSGRSRALLQARRLGPVGAAELVAACTETV